MVKNLKGGSGHKKFARKFTTVNKTGLIIADEPGKIYAIATTLRGNGFDCHCIDGQDRFCYFRGVFSGRGRRDNTVTRGSWVLVGLREWATTTSNKNNKEKCDLLEVYNDTEKIRLKETVSARWIELESNDASRLVSENKQEHTESNFVFGTETDFARDDLIKEIQQSNAKSIIQLNSGDNEDDNEEIDINDI